MRERLKKPVAAAGIAAAIGVAGLIASSLLSSQSDVSAMESLADRLHPESGWAPTDERVLGTFLCIPGDVPCGSLLRRWHTDHRLTLTEFQEVLTRTGWDFPIHGNCQQPTNVTGSIQLCSAEGRADSFHVEVSVISDGSGGPDLVDLRIVRRTG